MASTGTRKLLDKSFTGVEKIRIAGAEVYRLDYAGGLIRA